MSFDEREHMGMEALKARVGELTAATVNQAQRIDRLIEENIALRRRAIAEMPPAVPCWFCGREGR